MQTLQVDKEDFHPNLVRKVEAKNLPEQLSFRVKSEEKALVLEKLRKDMKNRNGKDGNQSLGEYITALAWMKMQELQEKEEEMNQAASW